MTEIIETRNLYLIVKNDLTYISYDERNDFMRVSTFNKELNAYDHSYSIDIDEIDNFIKQLESDLLIVKKMKGALIVREIIKQENNDASDGS